ncbi:MAG: hypothetical protein COW67_11520 [Flavobacteriales bacterium CG18_big_fil_WC_8_21_14_2_50_32_9]|nr:MAG: hypothetical protein COW67_11520 [Flavobacteriales bacterium CG18_big_fil_WC_8_21_14_2_50_32_9]
MFIYIWKKLKMQPYSWATFIMLLTGFIVGVIIYFIPFTLGNKIILISLKSSIFVLLYSLPIYYFKISLDINSFINKYLPDGIWKKY